jgi:hypothetical protein
MFEDNNVVDNIDDTAHEAKGQLDEKLDDTQEGFNEALDNLDDDEETETPAE